MKKPDSCEASKRLYAKEYRKKFPEKTKWATLKWRMAKQGLPAPEMPTRPAPEVCEICGRPETITGRSINLDHDHKTGSFRGWLCTKCNMVLGKMEDNPSWLRLAAEYLENGREKDRLKRLRESGTS